MAKKLKNGFTIAELIIVLAIISVITTLALIYANPKEKSIKYILSNTYYSLDKAFYNSFVVDNLEENNPFADNLEHQDTNDQGSERLCKALTSYINSPHTNCSATNLVSPNAEDSEFTDDKIQFTSPQGVRFYITKRITNGNTDDSGFYLIFADINGSNRPNSALYVPAVNNNSRTDPDIFAFAALPMGRVIPIGAPEVELAYMQTRVVYQYTDENTQETYAKFSNVTLPYYLAKGVAWGYYTNVEGAPNTEFPSTDEPFTWNDYIRSKIPQGSVILENFPNDLAISEQRYYVNEGKNPDTNMKCALADYDICGVNIDKYLY